MLPVARVREILGRLAVGLTDEQLVQRCREAEDAAHMIKGILDRRRQKGAA